MTKLSVSFALAAIVGLGLALSISLSSASGRVAAPLAPASADPASEQQSLVVSGDYDSNWGPVRLARNGARITGTYSCCGGGTIRGSLDGDVIYYTWTQNGGEGRGRWKVSEGGRVLTGTWGTGKSATSGGPWNLTRRAQIAQ